MPPTKPGSAPVLTAVLVGVLILLAAGLGWSWHSAGRATLLAADALRAQQVLTALAELQAAVNDAEAAPATAQAAVGATQARLRELLAGDAEQFTRLVALGPLIADRFDALPAPGVPAPRRIVGTPSGAGENGRLRQRIAVALAGLRQPAQAEFATGLQRSAGAARSARAAAVAPGVLALLLLGGAGWRLQRDHRHLAVARTDATRARQAQTMADTGLQQLMDTVADAVCVLDTEGRVLRVNSACQSLWGWPADGLVGRLWTDHVLAADQRRAGQALKAAQAAPGVQMWFSRSRHKDGRTVPMAWRAAWSAQQQMLLCAGRDLTEPESLRAEVSRTDQALQTTRADLASARGRAEAAGSLNSAFIETLGGQMNARAQAIANAADDLLQGGLGGSLTREQQRSLATVREHAQTLSRLVGAGLELASLETGQLQLKNEAFDVWETANEVAGEMRPLALDKGLKFDVRLAAELGYARGDAQRVTQVLRALLDNAIRCSEQGCISLHADVPQPGHVRFQVIDTGVGLAVEDQAALFEPSHAIGSTTAAQTQPGTGLGLALSRRLARLMGGDLVLEGSQPQHGSRFTFTLRADDVSVDRNEEGSTA